MTEPAGRDPLDVLAVPVDRPLPGSEPAPAFAAALRARLEAALLRPPTSASPTPSVSTSSASTSSASTSSASTSGAVMTAATLTPYLVVPDARAALAFYAEALGAVPHGEPYVEQDGRVGHAEVLVGGALLMLADEFPEAGLLGPLARGGTSTTLHLEVDDVDVAVARVVAAGGQLERPPADAPYGRTGVVRDPSGHRWMLQAPVPAPAAPPDPAAPELAAPDPAAVAYVTLAVPDTAGTREFYGQVLGWSYARGAAEDGWEVEGSGRGGAPAVGLGGGQASPEVQLCYRVSDLDRALAAVRAGGGSAQPPQDRPYGLLVECVDPSGLRFQLWQPPGDGHR